MKKRALAAVLWFLAAAYLWNVVASIAGISATPAILFGAAAAFLIAGDPLHRIWSTTDPER